MPIDISVHGASIFRRVGELFARARTRLTDDIEGESKVFALEAVEKAKKDYLRGPRPNRLGVVTGRLWSSIAQSVERDGDQVTIQIGSNVAYARAWEMGFSGTVNVPAHTRLIRKAFGKPITPRVVRVSAHGARREMRERPFLKPAVRDSLPAFEASIRRLLRGVVPSTVKEGGSDVQ
jgi:hypothetical protein